jgi:hypothetical protein
MLLFPHASTLGCPDQFVGNFFFKEFRMEPSDFVRDFDFENWATNNFCEWVADTDRNPRLQEMIAGALDPTRRNDPKVVEAWMTPAFLLAWDLTTWLEEIIAEWCRTHLQSGSPCGYFHLVDPNVYERDPPEFDPDRNLLFAGLIVAAAWEIFFDEVAEVLLTDANQQDVMHTSFRELSLVQPDRWAALASLPDRPEHEQPRDEEGALTTEGLMRSAAERRLNDMEREYLPEELRSDTEPSNRFAFQVWPPSL